MFNRLNILALIICLCSYVSWANDGVFYAIGNTLIPLEETKVELVKEILILEQQNSSRYMNVSVYFEFNNPDNEIERIVGFVTPPSTASLYNTDINHPEINNFTVIVNDEVLDYKVAKIDSTNFKSTQGKLNGNDFIFYFKVRFKKGLNIIQHTYNYQGSGVADISNPGPFYSYRLTTGKLWANKQIDDFELQIKMSADSYFTVPLSFTNDEIVNWEIVGSGNIGKVSPGKSKKRNIRLISGYLVYKTQNFKPSTDLRIERISPYSQIQDFKDIYYRGMYSNPRELKDLSAEDLRLLRNSFFAVHSYLFKSKDLSDYFSLFDWYIPNQEIDSEEILFNEWEERLLQQVLLEESDRNKK